MSSAYEAFYLHPELIKGLAARGRKGPSGLQRRAIPLILDGRDAYLLASLGLDSLMAYGLPLLSLVDPAPQVQAIVLVSDMNAAAKVATSLTELAQGLSLRIISLAGVPNPASALRRGGEVVVGTADQIYDLCDAGLDAKRVRLVVLDGLDVMLENGYRPLLEQVLGKCAAREQAIALSSTSSEAAAEFVRRHLKQAQVVRAEREATVPQAPKSERGGDRRPEPRPESRSESRGDSRSRRGRGSEQRETRNEHRRDSNPRPQPSVETRRVLQAASEPSDRPTTGPLVPLPRFQTTWSPLRVPLPAGHRYGRDSLHGWLAQQTGVPRSSMRSIVVQRDHATLEVENRSVDRFLAGMPGCEVS